MKIYSIFFLYLLLVFCMVFVVQYGIWMLLLLFFYYFNFHRFCVDTLSMFTIYINRLWLILVLTRSLHHSWIWDFIQTCTYLIYFICAINLWDYIDDHKCIFDTKTTYQQSIPKHFFSLLNRESQEEMLNGQKKTSVVVIVVVVVAWFAIIVYFIFFISRLLLFLI